MRLRCRPAVLVAMFAVVAAPLFALDPSRTLTQYVHNSWGPDRGFVGGTVYAMAQSSDGYLWLGTESGLVRFDGFEFTLLRDPVPGERAIGAVRGLVEDADGNLWIRLDGPHLLRYRNGVFEDAVREFGLSDAAFTAMSSDSRGELLLWGPRNRTLRYRDGRFSRISPRDSIEGIVVSVVEDRRGTLWLGSRDAGLYRIRSGVFSQIGSEERLQSVNVLTSSEDGALWIGSETGLHLWEHGQLLDVKLPGRLAKTQVYALARDRQDNLWVGTDDGLYRIDARRRVVTGFLSGTAGKEVSAIYEDRDGDLWFAGADGVERLRDGMFASFPMKENGGPVFVDENGRAWFAPLSGGLFCVENNVVKRVTVPGLGDDVIYSISGGDGEVWLGRQQGGLTELTRRSGGWTARTFTHKDGLAQNSVYTVTRARDGSVWAGTVSGGVSVLRHGRFKTYNVNNGLESNAIFSSMQAADGTLWFASPSGLVSFDGSRWKTYVTTDTQASPNVRTVFEDSGHVLWIGTSHGLAWFRNGRIETPPALPQALREEVLGIGQDAEGHLWIVTAQHVLQVERSRLLAGTLHDQDVLSYGAEDGLLETEGVRRDRSLAVDTRGRIWLSLPHSLAVADVRTAEGYGLPVRVRIDPLLPAETGARKGALDLPPETSSIMFRYAGMNLAMPDRTRFRYRLDGSDQAWSSDATVRQVVYAHLAPGHYMFRILASDGFGDWNGPETDVGFTLEPAFWQTWYFRLACVLALALAAVALYRMRLLKLTEQFNHRFQDRLAERTRIAQDLHDTLLQGVMSASMQLDIAQERLPEDSPARPMLQRILQQMRQVTEEGREALRGLRATDLAMSLEAALAHLPDEVGMERSAAYKVHVHGDSRPLRAAVRDEAYRIGREAAINAFSHARAGRIDLIIEYGTRAFRLLVRDDGCGMDAKMLKSGREGHWGLAGMRERAATIGSVLKIRSHIPGGTDVELIVPALLAFTERRTRRRWWPFSSRINYPEARPDGQPPL